MSLDPLTSSCSFDVSVMLCDVCKKQRTLMVNEIPGLGRQTSRCHDCVAAGAYDLDTVISATARMGGMFFAPSWWEEVVEDTTALFGMSHEEFLGRVDDWATDHHRRGVDYG